MMMYSNYISSDKILKYYESYFEFEEIIDIKKNINISILENNVLNIDVENNEENEINITKLDKNNFRIIF